MILFKFVLEVDEMQLKLLHYVFFFNFLFLLFFLLQLIQPFHCNFLLCGSHGITVAVRHRWRYCVWWQRSKNLAFTGTARQTAQTFNLIYFRMCLRIAWSHMRHTLLHAHTGDLCLFGVRATVRFRGKFVFPLTELYLWAKVTRCEAVNKGPGVRFV